MLMERQQQQPFVAQQGGMQKHQPHQGYVTQECNAHEHRVVGSRNGNDQGVAELGTASPAKLRGGAGVVEAKPQQIDGYAAPATMGYDGRAVEMLAQPAQGVGR